MIAPCLCLVAECAPHPALLARSGARAVRGRTRASQRRDIPDRQIKGISDEDNATCSIGYRNNERGRRERAILLPKRSSGRCYRFRAIREYSRPCCYLAAMGWIGWPTKRKASKPGRAAMARMGRLGLRAKQRAAKHSVTSPGSLTLSPAWTTHEPGSSSPALSIRAEKTVSRGDG